MKYRNKYTGVELELNSQVQGGGWEPVSEAEAVKEMEKPDKTKKSTKKGKK